MTGDCVTIVNVPLERLKRKFDDAWGGVGWGTGDQGTLETGQSLGHICAKERGAKIERYK